ncbi:uncharacterized protein BJ212DRAFT_806974 [Suillus subaureus]|uniref:DUF6534 domain-containing protein n=1 Tax=Suillus subaureus TaxID=48587 RepID=A0A9P7JHC1_9AGAM|nr:uncharacterized protein BJ212DRAFT_806974 [Suillus subaureus]KAG1822493.1 hypothetical protein BJ212DRAFT_806974 [Suillus subaureus]
MASSTQDLIPHLQLANTFGALFIGVVLAAVLFGVTIVQVFIYFQTHSGTGITFYKLVVILLWILDALHLALIVHCVYFYLVINYANVSALKEVVWSSKLQQVVAVLSIVVGHLLYVHRIWTVSKGRSKVLPITMGIFVVLISGLGIAVIWCIYQEIRAATDMVKTEWITYVYLGTVAFVDILIASSLCYLLATSRTGFSRLDLFVTKLMIYIINTGCLTSMCSMAVIILCAVMPNNYIFEAVDFLLIKLYVNSYIALLNARYYSQPQADRMYSSEYHIRHDVYRPKLHVRALQDEELQASQKSMFTHPDDGMLHITRPVQAVMPQRPIEVAMERNSLSSA